MGVSSDIAWAVIRNSSSFLLKKRGVKQPFSTEPCNLKNVNSKRYNGLVNEKVVGISVAAENKGYVLTTKTKKGATRPVKSMRSTTNGWSKEIAEHDAETRASGYKRCVEQEGPDQDSHETRCCHHQITEASA